MTTGRSTIPSRVVYTSVHKANLYRWHKSIRRSEIGAVTAFITDDDHHSWIDNGWEISVTKFNKFPAKPHVESDSIWGYANHHLTDRCPSSLCMHSCWEFTDSRLKACLTAVHHTFTLTGDKRGCFEEDLEFHWTGQTKTSMFHRRKPVLQHDGEWLGNCCRVD